MPYMPPCYKPHCCKASSVPYMPPCYKAHCCKASSVPYAFHIPVARLTAASSPPSLLSLRALCYYSLYTALCWSVFYTRDGLVWSVFYTPTVWSGLVWSGLCFMPNPSKPPAGCCSRKLTHSRALDRGNPRFPSNPADSRAEFDTGSAAGSSSTAEGRAEPLPTEAEQLFQKAVLAV